MNIDNTQISCDLNGEDSCKVTIPLYVTSSKGQYKNNYIGLSDSLNSMTRTNENSSLTLSSNKDYYALYQKEITDYTYKLILDNNYEPKTRYKNSFFTSNDSMNTVLSTTDSGTITDVPNSDSIFAKCIGWATNHDTTDVTYTDVSQLLTYEGSELYRIYRNTATFEKGDHVVSIEKTTDSCTMKYDELMCSVNNKYVVESGYCASGWEIKGNSSTSSECNYVASLIFPVDGKTYVATALKQ